MKTTYEVKPIASRLMIVRTTGDDIFMMFTGSARAAKKFVAGRSLPISNEAIDAAAKRGKVNLDAAYA
jgi:uncharacterized protein (DUF1684 family)